MRVHGCKAFLSGKNGTISNARKWAGAHVRESKIPAQGLHSTCAGMLAMHKEIGSVPRPDWTRTWFVVDALHHQNICKTRRKRIHTKCVVKHLLGAGLRYNVMALWQDERQKLANVEDAILPPLLNYFVRSKRCVGPGHSNHRPGAVPAIVKSISVRSRS